MQLSFPTTARKFELLVHTWVCSITWSMDKSNALHRNKNMRYLGAFLVATKCGQIRTSFWTKTCCKTQRKWGNFPRTDVTESNGIMISNRQSVSFISVGRQWVFVPSGCYLVGLRLKSKSSLPTCLTFWIQYHELRWTCAESELSITSSNGHVWKVNSVSRAQTDMYGNLSEFSRPQGASATYVTDKTEL